MGLLDDTLGFLKTPEGLGVLSGLAGWAAGARQGTPWNNVGRGGLAGLTGYNTALDNQRQDEGLDLAKQYKTMQMDQMKMAMEDKEKQRQLMESLQGKISKLFTPQTVDQTVGYKFDPQRDSSNVRFDTSNPNAESDYAKVATYLAQKQAKGQQLTPDEQMVFDQFKARFSPVTEKVQTLPNLENGIRTLGVQLMPTMPEVAKGFLTAAEQYKPQKVDAGSYQRDPVTGEMKFIGDPTKGVTVVNGRVVQMPGAAQALAGIAGSVKGAEAYATESGKAPFADPVVFKGAGQGGSDVIIPRVGMPGFTGALNTPSPLGLKGQEDFNKGWIANTYQPIQEAGKAAQAIASQVQTLRNIPINTGWGTDAKASGASVLEGLGVAPKNAALFAANAQKFQQVASERLWIVLNAAKGPQTEGDADRAKQTFAKLGNTPEANAFILDLAEATARRDQIKANYYQDAYPLVKDSGDYTKVDQEWRKVQKSVWDDPIMQKWKVQ